MTYAVTITGALTDEAAETKLLEVLRGAVAELPGVTAAYAVVPAGGQVDLRPPLDVSAPLEEPEPEPEGFVDGREVRQPPDVETHELDPAVVDQTSDQAAGPDPADLPRMVPPGASTGEAEPSTGEAEPAAGDTPPKKQGGRRRGA